jgi:tripartite-type tricarboxylate transporter receptor subunit TctC
VRKRFAAIALAVAVMGLPSASAQTFPTKPVRMIVPFAPGGGTDITARTVAQKLQEMWGQSVVIEYRPGAGSITGTDAVAKSPPDGYTAGVVTTAHVLNPALRSDMPYNTTKDLAGVSLLTAQDLVITATNSLPANSVAELIALAKKSPGNLTYATPGNGTAMHVAAELLKSMAAVDIAHIPYKGSAQAYPDVIAGRVSIQFDTLHASMTNIKAGKVKALGITGVQRAASLPNAATVAETIPGFRVQSVTGMVLPGATPRDIVNKMSADINRLLRAPDLAARLRQQDQEPTGTTPDEFDAFIRAEIDKWTKVVKSAGIKAD